MFVVKETRARSTFCVSDVAAVPESGFNPKSNSPRQIFCTGGFLIVFDTSGTFIFKYLE
jgi:hypothetical protein